MTFLEQLFDRLQRASAAHMVQEIRDGQFVSVTGSELLAMIATGPAISGGARDAAGRALRAART